MFFCKRCKKEFIYRYLLNKHLTKRKTKCISKEKRTKCKYCKKYFDRYYNLKRHQKVCSKNLKSRKKIVQNSDEKYMKRKLKKIKLINCNDEEFETNKTADILTQEKIDDALYPLGRGVTKLIKLIHFNKRLPQYHTVFIQNLSRPYGYVFENNTWQIENVQEIIENLMNNILEYYVEYIEKNKDPMFALSNDIKKAIEICEAIEYKTAHKTVMNKKLFNEIYEQIKFKTGIEKRAFRKLRKMTSAKLYKKIFNDVKFLLYEYHSIPEKTKKIYDLQHPVDDD